jgi:zeta-carotene desaturase
MLALEALASRKIIPSEVIGMKKVIIVGGGFAGASAALELQSPNVQVELIESRGMLGGRFYSFPPTQNFPFPIDNGPHLMMGCYHETLRLFKKINALSQLTMMHPLQLSWVLPNQQKQVLHCSNLPAPFHLLFGLWNSKAFTWKDKMNLVQSLHRFKKKPFSLPTHLVTVEDFLSYIKASPNTQELFWNPLCKSILNLPPQVALIRSLGEVFSQAFFQSIMDSRLVFFSKPLSEIFFPNFKKIFESNHGLIHYHEGIQEIKIQNKTFELISKNQKCFSGDALILAIPPYSIHRFSLNAEWIRTLNFESLGKSSIMSVHLVLSQAIFHEPFLGLPYSPFDWIFNQTQNWNYQTQEQYLSLVRSASSQDTLNSDAFWIQEAEKVLRSRFKINPDLKILYSKVTREMAATFVWNQTNDALRPSSETSFQNIFLAGDWTQTHLPATIESACLSGYLAASKVKTFLNIN